MGIAMSATKTARDNKEDIEAIEAWMEEQQEQQEELESRLLQIHGLIDNNIKATDKLYGFVKANKININALQIGITCVQLQINYQSLADETIKNVKETLTFIMEGKTFGQLTPKILNPEQLKFVTEATISKTSVFYAEHYHTLYQTATAYLLKTDFVNNLFTILLTYPNMVSAQLLPIYDLQQVGFWGKNSKDNTEVCLQFQTPQHVVLDKDNYYVLDSTAVCPKFGSVVMCAKHQYTLIPITQCLRMEDADVDSCTLKRCGQKAYISTQAGIFIRTSDTHILVVSTATNDVATTKNISVPEYRTIFIRWDANVSSVQFEGKMIYAPKINAHQTIERKVFQQYPLLNWTYLLEVPKVGSMEIDNELKRYRSEIDKLKLDISNPQQLLGTITQIPKWIKAAAYVLVLICIVGIGFKIKQILDCCCPQYRTCFHCGNNKPKVIAESVPMTNQNRLSRSIYPDLPEGPEPSYTNVRTLTNVSSDQV